MARRHNSITAMSTQPTFEARLQTLLFSPLNADGSNFLEWVNDAKSTLSADNLARTLTTPPATTSTNPVVPIPEVCKWQALLILRRHLDHSLRL
jgi:hypothetical protein